MVAAKTELDRVAERGAADHFNLDAVTESHFEQAATKVVIAAHGDHASFAADAQLVQAAGIGRSAMITGVIAASLFHGKAPITFSTHNISEYYIIENEFQLRNYRMRRF
jgi:choline dehydrogenase-like flavoprotein